MRPFPSPRRAEKRVAHAGTVPFAVNVAVSLRSDFGGSCVPLPVTSFPGGVEVLLCPPAQCPARRGASAPSTVPGTPR